MTKKRIADLLKEEVEKTSEATQTQAKGTSQPAQPAPDSTSATGKATSSRTRKRPSKSSTTTTKQAATKTSSTSTVEKQIAKLETALNQAKEQIVGLQGDIEPHQARIFELKDELTASQKATAEQTQALPKATAELETAKDTIRKITAAQKENAAAAQKEKPTTKVIHGADLATNRNTLSLRNRPSSYKAIPEYAIQRGEQNNSMLSDDDIGWVD